MTSHAPVWSLLAVVVACLLPVRSADFDHHAVQLLTLTLPQFSLSKFGRLSGVADGNKVRPPLVR